MLKEFNNFVIIDMVNNKLKLLFDDFNDDSNINDNNINNPDIQSFLTKKIKKTRKLQEQNNLNNSLEKWNYQQK